MTLGTASGDNLLRSAIAATCPSLRGDYEVIVDYKGSRRPDLQDADRPYWQQGEWQVLTYSWLRSRQAGAIPVAAGVLIYVNELSPGADDIAALKKAIRATNTDVLPREGSPDWYAIQNWRPGLAIPELSAGFRHARAIRILPVVQDRIEQALSGFDGVVRDIEACVAGELAAGIINDLWRPCGDEETCNACDCRYFCPHPAPRSGDPVPPSSPPAP